MPTYRSTLLVTAGLICAAPVSAQVPVDAAGEPYPVESGAMIEDPGPDGIPLASSAELDELIAPVALYPDPLLAVVLPAAAYPLQIVQAARFLEALEDDPTLTPPKAWDESVVALLNYPEVLADLNRDLDWTLRLGEAVIAQQGDVMAAVQRFRNRAYAAGNLESDPRQTVRRDDDIIEIAPANEEIIYVPSYEPSAVVVASSRPVVSYYPEPYPVYYYPYADGHSFRRGFFWGVTTAYAFGWHQHRLRVLHHSFYGHPYYARDYGWRWWYRRPTLVYHNNIYFRDRARYGHYRSRLGDYWVPRPHYRPWRPAWRNVPRTRTRDGYAGGTAAYRSRELSTNSLRSTTQARPPAERERRSTQRATNNQYSLTTRRERSGSVTPPRNDRNARVQQNRPASATTRSTYRRNEPTRQQAVKPRSTAERPARRQEAPARAPSRANRPAPQRERSSGRREHNLQRRDDR